MMRVQIFYDRGQLFQASVTEMVSAHKNTFTSHALSVLFACFSDLGKRKLDTRPPSPSKRTSLVRFSITDFLSQMYTGRTTRIPSLLFETL